MTIHLMQISKIPNFDVVNNIRVSIYKWQLAFEMPELGGGNKAVIIAFYYLKRIEFGQKNKKCVKMKRKGFVGSSEFQNSPKFTI